jgi:hypothetical protein
MGEYFPFSNVNCANKQEHQMSNPYKNRYVYLFFLKGKIIRPNKVKNDR